MKEVVMIDAVRTPIGRYGGGLSAVRPDDLLAHTYKALIERTGLDPSIQQNRTPWAINVGASRTLLTQREAEHRIRHPWGRFDVETR